MIARTFTNNPKRNPKMFNLLAAFDAALASANLPAE